MLTLSATVLPVILVLLPVLGTASVTLPREAATATLEGIPALTVVAASGGAVLCGPGGEPARRVPLAALDGDAGLRTALAEARRAPRPLLLVVEPDGLEVAFVLEPILAAFGPGRIKQVRFQPGSPPLTARGLCGASRAGTERRAP